MNLLASMGCLELLGLLYRGKTPIHRSEFKFANEKTAYTYAGYDEKVRAHHFWVALHTDEGQIIVRDFEIWLGVDGRLVAEMLDDPVATFQDTKKALEFIWAKRRDQNNEIK